MQPSLLGQIQLELKDGTVETYDDGSARHRAKTEFQVYADAIARQDYEFCRRAMEKSLEVAKVMNRARIQAGVHYPCD